MQRGPLLLLPAAHHLRRGCVWMRLARAGMAADKAAHEKACVIAVCQRMMAPLQAKNQQLQSQNQQLQMESQQLQARVAALEPLQERGEANTLSALLASDLRRRSRSGRPRAV